MNILFYTEIIGVGGIENMMLQWIGHSDSDIHVDIFVNKVVDETNRKRFLDYGCKIFEANCSVKNLIKKSRVLSRVLKESSYDAIHVHTSLSTDFFALACAKKNGIKMRIAHSHNVPVIPHFLTRLADRVCKPLLRHYTTHFYGCSKEAAIALFGNKKNFLNKYIVIKNGINVEKFLFSLSKRAEIRKSFNISDDDFVVGSVGRFDYQKNFAYLLTVVQKVDYKKLKVLIIGEGDEKDSLINFARENRIDVIFPGRRDNISDFLSAFDLFVLTSRYEGFPVVMMEAQANGLACMVSTAVPKEASLNSSNKRLQLWDDAQWVDSLKQVIREYSFSVEERKRGTELIIQHGYDISSCSKELMNYYKQKND